MLTFDSLADLNGIDRIEPYRGQFGNIALTESSAGRRVLAHTVHPALPEKVELSFLSPLLAPMFAEYSWSYEVRFPARVLESNGETVTGPDGDANVVRWSFDLGDLVDEPRVMEATITRTLFVSCMLRPNARPGPSSPSRIARTKTKISPGHPAPAMYKRRIRGDDSHDPDRAACTAARTGKRWGAGRAPDEPLVAHPVHAFNSDEGGRKMVKTSGKKLATALLAAAGLAGPVTAAAVESKDPIKLTIHDWTGQYITTQIMGAVLEEMGYNVEYVQADYIAQFAGLEAGDLHVAMEMWETTGKDAMEASLATGKTVDLGETGMVAIEEWWYPMYMKEKCPGPARLAGAQRVRGSVRHPRDPSEGALSRRPGHLGRLR